MELISYKCPNCGGDVRFDPPSQNYKCEYCMSLFTQEELERLMSGQSADGANGRPVAADGHSAEAVDSPAEADVERADAERADAVLYTCPSCGAQIVTDETTAAAFCYYCHNPVVLAGRMKGEYRPDRIIPFAIDRKQALQIFDQWIGRKKYIPADFYSKDQIEKLTGVYFPYWLYDCRVEGKVDADASRVKTWRVGNIRYTQTEKYDVSRDGSMEVENLARGALSKANRQLVEGVFPFDMEKLQPFQMGFLSGFMAENRDLGEAQFVQEVENEVKEFTGSSLRSQISGYNTVQVRSQEMNIADAKWNYALLPVWTLTYRDKRTDKIYYFACNGQTGKVCGMLPVDNRRLAGLFAAIFAPVCLALLVVGYFL